jgi:hypothetical protein
MGLIFTPEQRARKGRVAGAVLWIERPQDNTMNRIDFYYILTVALITVAMLLPTHRQAAHPVAHKRPTPSSLVTKEQRASHGISFKDQGAEEVGECTGTAVGPHAILTASHCILSAKTSLLSIDYAPEIHELLDVSTDGRDHVILLLDGAPFTTYERVDASDSLLIGDTVTLYGIGGSNYPPVPKFGKVVDCEDPSDVDADAKEFCFTIPTIPGDSGAAIYNTKGQIVGIVTYGLDYGDGSPTGGIGFALGFTHKQYDYAMTFDGKPPVKVVGKK